jgi:hypothetical protein
MRRLKNALLFIGNVSAFGNWQKWFSVDQSTSMFLLSSQSSSPAYSQEDLGFVLL